MTHSPERAAAARVARWGDQTPMDRFMAKVDRSAGPDGCWPWTGYRQEGGYGQFHAPEGTVSAYRWLFVKTNGQIPDGLELDHVCRNPPCVNPAHLEPVTHETNMRRSPSGMFVRRDACFQGHPFTDMNTYQVGRRRICRACRRAYSSAYGRRRRTAA